jgi:hypothetical protein
MRRLEQAVALLVIGGCALFNPSISAAVAVGASFIGFIYMQTVTHSTERQAAIASRNQKTATRLTRLLFARESLWIGLFLLNGNLPGLAGSALFVAYPFWRRYWLERAQAQGADFGDEYSIAAAG